MEIMEKGVDSVNKVLTHIRDHPDEPCLIHCTGLNTIDPLLQYQASDI